MCVRACVCESACLCVTLCLPYNGISRKSIAYKFNSPILYIFHFERDFFSSFLRRCFFATVTQHVFFFYSSMCIVYVNAYMYINTFVRSFGGGKFVALRSLALDQSREHAEFFLLRFFFIPFIFSEKRDSEKKSSWSECVYAVRTSVCVHVFFLWGENNFASYSFIQARSVSYTSHDSYSIKFDRQIQFGQHIRVSQYFFSFWKTTFYKVKEVNS